MKRSMRLSPLAALLIYNMHKSGLIEPAEHMDQMDNGYQELQIV